MNHDNSHGAAETSPVMQLLQLHGIVAPGKGLESVLLRPFSELKATFGVLLASLRDSLTPTGRARPLFLYPMFPFQLRQTVFELLQQTEPEEVKAKAALLCRYLDGELVEAVRPMIFDLLRWDWERRTWRPGRDQDRVKALRRLHVELSAELSEAPYCMISKYSRLAFAYILEQYARAIAHVDETGLSDREKEQAFRTFNQLERLDVALGELGLVDVEDQAVFREVYQAQAQALIDGLIRPLGQFDGLLRGFIEAQQDYQLFLEALLDLWEGGERSPDRKIRDAFARHDIDGGIVLLNAVIAKVPYYLLRFDREAAYHLIVHLTLILVGCDIQSEVAVLRGRIDARLELENCVYLMEFKLQDAATAIRQILDRGYALPEGLHTKPVFALGLVFDTKHRRIAPEYELRPIDSTRS